MFNLVILLSALHKECACLHRIQTISLPPVELRRVFLRARFRQVVFQREFMDVVWAGEQTLLKRIVDV